MSDIATPLPQLELGPGATVEVDTGNPAAVVTGLVVYGTYFPPGDAAPIAVSPLFVPVPLDEGS